MAASLEFVVRQSPASTDAYKEVVGSRTLKPLSETTGEDTAD
jgi:hypothetical protein